MESKPTYTLTTSVVGEGSITPAGGVYEEGEVVSIISSPNNGWLFNNWSGDGSGSSSTITVTMDRDKNVMGNFSERLYPLNITVIGEGSVEEEVIQSKSEHTFGTVVRLTPVPETGWNFDSWSGGVTTTDEVVTVTVDGEVNITVTFERIDYPDREDSAPDFSIANTGPYILNVSHLDLVKSNLDDPLMQQEYNRLIEGADMLAARNDFQFVTDKTHIPPSGDIHDYMSIARYLWPDRSGVYTITRDGITNPEIYNYDRPKLADVTSAIYTLSLAWYFSDNELYARKASELIHGWFLDEATRMNPNMNHAQVAKGVNTGELQGIIDANDFIQVIEAVGLIYDSSYWTHSSHIRLKEWFYHFSRWYVRRYNADAFCSDTWCNNVSTWMDVQRASIFLFTEQEDLINSASHILPIQTKIAKQIAFDGTLSFERQRNQSQHYVYFNLWAFMNIALIRKNRTGYDRDWPYLQNSEYGGLKPALDIIANYLGGADVAGFFVVNPKFNTCRYLKIFRPAAILFDSPVYDQAARSLIEQGCSDPDIVLTFPPLMTY